MVGSTCLSIGPASSKGSATALPFRRHVPAGRP
jgi:hypothetical protein